MTTKIAPHGPSGFDHVDVLEQAEENDELYVEFDFPDEDGIYGVEATVENVDESTDEDEQTREIKISLNANHTRFHQLILWVHSSTFGSRNHIIDKIDVMENGDPDWETRELGDFHTAEIERTNEDSDVTENSTEEDE
ncbi:hypothetical protein G9464_20740 [Halostella sp. JP-L12]|uniref:hypothetical protein n=1 Tax=Halostella TaxID=1843185 RepID=UPI000EF834DD|nr:MULTISPECIES: hypothetical protein [Halostella]NHN49999.1 hypothetical protein [Halostella sp. JP-L12]